MVRRFLFALLIIMLSAGTLAVGGTYQGQDTKTYATTAQRGGYSFGAWSQGEAPDTSHPTITSAVVTCIDGSTQRLNFGTDEDCLIQWRSGVGAAWGDWTAWTSTAHQSFQIFDYTAGQPMKTYNFEVNAKDIAGNPATNDGAGDSFTWDFTGACP